MSAAATLKVISVAADALGATSAAAALETLTTAAVLDMSTAAALFIDFIERTCSCWISEGPTYFTACGMV